MKVLETFIHNPLGRQCSEAVWIRHTEPDKRINAKTEYHQPGDVEIRFEKSVNERTKNKKMAAELAKSKDNNKPPVRNENDNLETTNEEESDNQTKINDQ